MAAHASQELQLLDFCSKAKHLFDECTHQQFLKIYGWADLWNMRFYLARIMFANALLMNVLVLVMLFLLRDDDLWWW
jgi:hypothetical protein